MKKRIKSLTILSLLTFTCAFLFKCSNELNDSSLKIPNLDNNRSEVSDESTDTGPNYNFYIALIHWIDTDDNVSWSYSLAGSISDPYDLDHGDEMIPGIYEEDKFIGSLKITDPNGLEFAVNYMSYETGALIPDDPHVDRLDWGTVGSMETGNEPPIGVYNCELIDAYGNVYVRTTILNEASIEKSSAFPIMLFPENGSTITDNTPTFHWEKYPNEPLDEGHMSNFIYLRGPLHLPDDEQIEYQAGSEEGGPNAFDTEFFLTYPEGGDPNLPSKLLPGDYFLFLEQNINLEGGGESHPNYCTQNRGILFTLQAYIETQIDFIPKKLKIKDNFKDIKAFITPPEGYSVQDIIVSSLTLLYKDQSYLVEKSSIENDTLMIKFNTSDIGGILEISDAVELTIVGELTDGIQFKGSNYVSVVRD